VACTTPDFQSDPSPADARESANASTKRDPGDDVATPDATVVGQSWGDGDAVEQALATALDAATAARRFDVVAQLARELEVRRTLAQSANAVPLRR